MHKRKSITAGFTAAVTAILLMACSPGKDETVFSRIIESPAARMELPDGSGTYVASEIALLRSFADLEIQPSPLEPADNEGDWLYRIIFNPSEKVTGAEEIVVSFHKDYIQINTEYYLPADGVSYESILEWAEGISEYFLK